MNKTCNIIWLLALLIILSACGPSAQEITQKTATAATATAAAWTPTPTATATSTTTPTLTPTHTATPTPVPAGDLMAKNLAAMNALKTESFMMDITMDIGDQSLLLNMTGVYENPDKAYVEAKILNEKIESVTLSQGEIYTRQPGSKVWIKSSTTNSVPDYKSQLAIGDIAETPVLKGEETLDGVDCYVVEFGVDVEKYIANDPTLSKMTGMMKSTGNGTIWIGKDDFLTRKSNMEMTIEIAGQKLNYLINGSNSGFNEPIQIPDPTPYYTQVVLSAGDPIFEVTFSPDSSLLAVCDDDQLIYLWSTADLSAKPEIIQHPDLQKEGFLQTADYYSLAFSSDGKTLAAGTQGQVLLYSLSDLSAEPVALIPPGLKREIGNDINTVNYSPDGKFLAAGSSTKDIYVWSVGNLKAAPRVLKGHPSEVIDLTFTPDGKTLISGSKDGTILLWSVKNLKSPKETLTGHKEDLHALEVTPDGQYLLSAGFNDPVYAWSLAQPANQPESLIPRQDEEIGKYPTLDIAISPDGGSLATADTMGVVHLWELANPELPFGILSTQSQSDLMTIAYSQNGKYIAAGSGDAKVYVWVQEEKP